MIIRSRNLSVVRAYTTKSHQANNLPSTATNESSSTTNTTATSTTSNSATAAINIDNLKINFTKAIDYATSTLNNMQLREKITNTINSISNDITSLEKTLKKLDTNKTEIIGNSSGMSPSKPNPSSSSSQVKITKNNLEARSNELVLKRRAIEDQTKFLCSSIQKSSSTLIKTLYIEALSKHLYEYTEARSIAYEENIIKHLIELKNMKINDIRLNGNINECLVLLGVVKKIRNAGINVLSLDGGGAKGFVTIEILKNIEKKSGKRIYELFDYICGTSTGAILACLIGIYKISLDECERHYKAFVKEMFERNTAIGIGNLLMNQAFYDSKSWEKMLRDAMGDKLIIHSVRDDSTPKIGVVTSLTTPNHMKVFLFRNYNYPHNQQSHYDGTHKHSIWQAVRASSAAPGYYEDFKVDGLIFHDGGVLANNPAAIALHEAKHLWPSNELQCVISIGNGRYQPAEYVPKCESLSLKQKVNRIVGGATSTESEYLTLCLFLRLFGVLGDEFCFLFHAFF